MGTAEEWNREFSRKVERAEKHLDKARSGRRDAIRETLNDLFLNLSVVRNQIVHGASAGSGGWGRTQYELGAKLLKALIPCFREVIRSNIEDDWGAPPFARVGEGPDDECPPPWLS